MSDDKYEIDIQEFAKALQSGQGLNGKDGVLTPLIKKITEAAMGAEIDQHLESEPENRKKGKSRKTIKTMSGEFELETPRDRNGTPLPPPDNPAPVR
ncbi:Transposase, Mutator family [Vibrio quintilis]|uniref:Mutator family transposase n=1 Tax=Vibrio quintilis TaxID=1117707 RepID=A0A1M7Z1W7_9VIBR|nr:Transposase, Mutator family [Vibrio quintilis]